MTVIEGIFIRKILDSRGNPTVEVDIITPLGFGTAAAPSGASTGEHEVAAIPKKGIDAAIVSFRKEVIPRLIGMDTLEQGAVDDALKAIDGTANLERIGGNLIVATSMAAAKAAADAMHIPLYLYLGGRFGGNMPFPFGNVLGGGRHAIGGTNIQEFMAVAMENTATVSIFANAMVHKEVSKALQAKFPGVAIGKGDEGAWVAKCTDEEALDLVTKACARVSASEKITIKPALDVAASELYDDKTKVYKYDGGKKLLAPKKQIDFITTLIEKAELHSVEDPLEQNDFQGYAELTDKVGDHCTIIGDDLFVTNIARLQKGIEMGACNAILIKPNQCGTLTDTINCIKYAHDHKYRTVISHRSGETTDETIAHIAVAFGAHGIKTGAVGGERIAKLNELVRIEETYNKVDVQS